MPRFYFNIHDHVSAPDLEGTELPDVHVAQAEAIRLAGEMMRDLGRKFWDGSDWRLEMTDAEGRTLFVVRFSAEEVGDATIRSTPPLAPPDADSSD